MDLKVDDLEIRAVCQPKTLTRTQKATIGRWLTGAVCFHQECYRCGEELSRKHGIQCSGAENLLEKEFPGIRTEAMTENTNIITLLLNRNKINKRYTFYEKITQAISRILEICRNINVTESGYWEPKDQAQTSSETEITVPLVGNQSSNPELTEQRRRIAQQENRRIGRPWWSWETRIT